MDAYVIDPTPFQRKVLGLLLKEEGFDRVGEASRVEDLPDQAGKILFADVSLDPEPINKLGIPWIVTGPETEDEKLADRVTRGAAAFLTKPFTLPALRQAIADASFVKPVRTSSR